MCKHLNYEDKMSSKVQNNNSKHSIIRAAFCAFVCSPTPPRSFDGSSPNLLGVCRWTSELPLRGSFLKSSTGQRVNGSNVTFSEQTTPGCDHTAAKGVPSKRHTASKSLIPSMGIFTSNNNTLIVVVVIIIYL